MLSMAEPLHMKVSHRFNLDVLDNEITGYDRCMHEQLETGIQH